MSTAFVETVTRHFENVTDPRADRGLNHPLTEMVFVTLCGAICDCNSWVDVAEFGQAKLTWFRKFLPFERGVPSHDMFSEVFARLDSVQFYAALQSWTTSIAGSLNGRTVAFDGKTLRGSFDKASAKSALHSVSAWVCDLKLCLGLNSVDDKSNEIPASPQSALPSTQLQNRDDHHGLKSTPRDKTGSAGRLRQDSRTSSCSTLTHCRNRSDDNHQKNGN